MSATNQDEQNCSTCFYFLKNDKCNKKHICDNYIDFKSALAYELNKINKNSVYGLTKGETK